MRLRTQRGEANEDLDQSASVDTEGPNRGRALQSREVHGVVDGEREDGVPRTDVPQQQ